MAPLSSGKGEGFEWGSGPWRTVTTHARNALGQHGFIGLELHFDLDFTVLIDT